MTDEAKYYIALYITTDGDRVKGNWKDSMEGIEEEKKRYAKMTGYISHFHDVGSISQQKVKDVAAEHGISIAEALDCIRV